MGNPFGDGGMEAQERSGVTLIEVLVAMAILVILAAQMLCALTRAKGKSYDTVCKNNLRQVGVGMQMYLDDSAGAYPYVESVLADNPRHYSSWFDALGSCIPSARWGEGIFKCPAYRGIFYEGEGKVNRRGNLTAVHCPCGSYAYNSAGRRAGIFGVSEPVSPGLGFGICGGRPLSRPVFENDIRAPADLYAIGDAPLGTGRWGALGTLRLGGAADYNSFADENLTINESQHPAVFNMLFADIHAESVKTRVLLSTNAAYRSRWNHDHLP